MESQRQMINKLAPWRILVFLLHESPKSQNVTCGSGVVHLSDGAESADLQPGSGHTHTA